MGSASSEDKIAYEEIFKPAGLSWMSYNAIKASGAIEWIDLASNEEVMFSDLASKKSFLTNDIYWLARGEINIANSEGQMSKQMSMRDENRLISASHVTKCVAGEKGGTSLLKISSSKMSKVLQNDSKIKSCMQSLAFVGACQ